MRGNKNRGKSDLSSSHHHFVYKNEPVIYWNTRRKWSIFSLAIFLSSPSSSATLSHSKMEESLLMIPYSKRIPPDHQCWNISSMQKWIEWVTISSVGLIDYFVSCRCSRRGWDRRSTAQPKHRSGEAAIHRACIKTFLFSSSTKIKGCSSIDVSL